MNQQESVHGVGYVDSSDHSLLLKEGREQDVSIRKSVLGRGKSQRKCPEARVCIVFQEKPGLSGRLD